MKKVGLLFLCFLFLVFLTAGCSKDHDNPPSGGQQGTGKTTDDGGGTDTGTDTESDDTDLPDDQPINTIHKVYGLNFGPFTRVGQNPDAGSSVSKEQVENLMKTVAPYTEWIRAFGSMNGAEFICRVAHEKGLKSYGSAWLSDDLSANEREINALIAEAKAGYVDAIIVGSETLYRGDLTEDQLLGYMDRVALAVPDIPITTAETYGVILDHPNLIEASDFVLVNYYPYWEGTSVEYAVAQIHAQHRKIKAMAGDKEVIVSETGWPSCGETIGQAVPSVENASFYFKNITSWAKEEGVKVIHFEAFDEHWKVAYEGDQGGCWGIWTSDQIMKEGFQDVFDGETMEDNWSNIPEPGGPGDPEIDFIYVPPIGSYANLEGQVLHVKPEDYRVVVYIYVGRSWWIKPTYDYPKTTIQPDGTFFTDITTGGIDQKATAIYKLMR